MKPVAHGPFALVVVSAFLDQEHVEFVAEQIRPAIRIRARGSVITIFPSGIVGITGRQAPWLDGLIERLRSQGTRVSVGSPARGLGRRRIARCRSRR